MKIFKKIDERLKGSSNWILHTPESLTILLLMGTGIGSLFFTVLALAMFFNKRIFFGILFAVFAFGAVKMFIKLFKLFKAVGLKDALGGFTASEFVWQRDKNWRKIGGENGKHNETIKADEICNKRDEEENGRFGKEIRHIYR